MHPYLRRVAAVVYWTANLILAQHAVAGTPKVLYQFDGNEYPGQDPKGTLIAGAEGVLYGTASAGGEGHCGTVFQLTPPAAGQTEWTETLILTLYDESAGCIPGSLVKGRGGVLYGLAFFGGGTHCEFGTVFALTPPSTGQTVWTETVLHHFAGEGIDPGHPLSLLYRNGTLYGTTVGDVGTPNSHSAVFRLTPPRPGATDWQETVLHIFIGKDATYEGNYNLSGGVIVDQTGTVYGTTFYGGTYGLGTAYKLTAPSGGTAEWTETVLHSFGASPGDTTNPNSTLTMDAAGALYGTGRGGAAGDGTVFRLTPPAAGETRWRGSVLYNFCTEADCADGSYPGGALTLFNGRFYGVTYFGGMPNLGTVYELSPPAAGGSVWRERVLTAFDGTDGSYPSSPVTEYRGMFYGETGLTPEVLHGNNGPGEIFRLHVPRNGLPARP